MSSTPNRLAGTANLTVDGVPFLVVGEFEYNPSSMKRESLSGMDGVHGFKETPNVPHIGGSIRDGADVSLATLNAMDNVTVVVTLANGKIIVGRNMWTVEDQTSKAADGTIEIRWEGPSVIET